MGAGLFRGGESSDHGKRVGNWLAAFTCTCQVAVYLGRKPNLTLMSETTTTGAPKRPTFLTVLCILSFVAAGFSIIGGGLGLAAGAAVESGALSDLAAQSGDSDAMAQMEAAMGEVEEATGGVSLTTLFGVGLVLTLVGLVGVIMMWKLKKTGFYVYTGAQVAGIVAPIAMGGEFGMMGTLFSVLFIVLYGLNLKHMS